MIYNPSEFRWPEPIKTDLAKWDRGRRCAYHKDRDHTTEQFRNLHYLVERLIKVGQLKQYVHAIGGQRKTAQAPTSLTAPRAVISHMHRGPIDERYNSKWKRQRLLRVASIREWVNSISTTFQNEVCTSSMAHLPSLQ